MGITLAIMAMALSLGLFVTHHLIPPTPGPVAAAGILEADLGMVILLGFPISIVALMVAWQFSVRFAKRYFIKPYPDNSDGEHNDDLLRFERSSTQPEVIPGSTEKRPSLFRSLMPIFIPILLIILRSVNDLPSTPFGTGYGNLAIGFLGQPSVALLIGVGLSFLLPVKLTRDMLSSSGWLGQGIIAAATIIIVTGSGGAFGKVLQDSGIATVLEENLSGARSLGIWLPIIIAASLKIAQGSGTVSIITTASIMAPLVASLGLDAPVARALVVVSIGAGSMIASHANDSYFWVVTQMSGMNVNQGYRLQTVGTLVLGICASVSVWILSLWIL